MLHNPGLLAFAHVLFGKPVPTFPGHALDAARTGRETARRRRDSLAPLHPPKRSGAGRTAMKTTMRLAASLVATSVAVFLGAAPAAMAADYPAKPVTLIIGFAPGGPSDVMARILTKKMEEVLKQPLIIENRTGAGGGLAATTVARSAPDGYTVLLATGSSLAINVGLYKNLGYDPEKDFEPISLIGMQTNVLY